MSQAIALRVRPSHLVAAALATLALMAALASFVGGGSTASREVGAVTPTRVFLPIPQKVTSTVDDAPAPAAHAAKPRVARQAGSGTGTSLPAQGTATTGGGDTNVTVDNGSSDTDTSSGGSHVNNSAAVSANASTHSAEDEEP